jgi:hypothetical protein
VLANANWRRFGDGFAAAGASGGIAGTSRKPGLARKPRHPSWTVENLSIK